MLAAAAAAISLQLPSRCVTELSQQPETAFGTVVEQAFARGLPDSAARAQADEPAVAPGCDQTASPADAASQCAGAWAAGLVLQPLRFPPVLPEDAVEQPADAAIAMDTSVAAAGTARAAYPSAAELQRLPSSSLQPPAAETPAAAKNAALPGKAIVAAKSSGAGTGPRTARKPGGDAAFSRSMAPKSNPQPEAAVAFGVDAAAAAALTAAVKPETGVLPAAALNSASGAGAMREAVLSSVSGAGAIRISGAKAVVAVKPETDALPVVGSESGAGTMRKDILSSVSGANAIQESATTSGSGSGATQIAGAALTAAAKPETGVLPAAAVKSESGANAIRESVSISGPGAGAARIPGVKPFAAVKPGTGALPAAAAESGSGTGAVREAAVAPETEPIGVPAEAAAGLQSSASMRFDRQESPRASFSGGVNASKAMPGPPSGTVGAGQAAGQYVRAQARARQEAATRKSLPTDSALEAGKPQSTGRGRAAEAGGPPDETHSADPQNALLAAQGDQPAQAADKPEAPVRADAPRSPFEPDTGSQLAGATIRTLIRGETRYHLKLRPEGVGEVAVTISARDRELRLDIRAASGTTRDLITDQIGALKNELATNGYHLDGFNVDVSGNSQGSEAFSAPQQDPGRQPQERQPEARSGTPQGATLAGPSQPDRVLEARAGSIRYRV